VPDHFRRLDPDERLAAIGALVVLGSLLLPWYGLPIGDVVKTGVGSFGWIQLALMITIGGALVLLYECSHGRVLPAPLDEGALLAACGVWAAVLVAFRMFDKPSFELGALGADPNLRYGVFVAFGGAVLLAVAGVRKRRAGSLTPPSS
jgi:hypothetical protein